jgi:hypothetical protein
MMDVQLTGNPDWKNLQAFSSRLLGIMTRGPDRLMLRIVKIVSDNFKRSIRDVGKIRNSQATIVLKGSSTPLIDSGKLVESIVWKKLSRFVYFAGIDPNAKTSRGVPYSVIAARQNEGYIIPVTDEIRAFMAVHGIAVRADTTFFVVPPRPFLSVALEKSLSQIQAIAIKEASAWASMVRMY